MIELVNIICPICEGTGNSKITPHNPCWCCDGTGYIEKVVE